MMIIREREHDFIMIKQHDHAIFSGQIAKHLKSEYFVMQECYEDVVLAIQEHDRGWIGLDESPIWNDRMRAPFSFLDYPRLPKLAFYKIGLDEIERLNSYAGLLCSLHHSSFFLNSEQSECIAFSARERERQRNIREHYNQVSEESISIHFRLLQFCDDASLFVCLNEPGIHKNEEHPWYKDGIPNSEFLNIQGGKPIVMNWMNNKKIRSSPFPFKDESTVKLNFKRVQKNDISELGIESAYKNADLLEQEVIFCN